MEHEPDGYDIAARDPDGQLDLGAAKQRLWRNERTKRASVRHRRFVQQLSNEASHVAAVQDHANNGTDVDASEQALGDLVVEGAVQGLDRRIDSDATELRHVAIVNVYRDSMPALSSSTRVSCSQVKLFSVRPKWP